MSLQKTLTPRSMIELALLAAIWGASFLTVRIALDEVAPLTVVAHRVGWAALVLWAVVLVMGQPLPRGRAWLALLAMGVLNNVIPFTLLAWAQLHIETGLVAILNAATAIFAVLVAALVFADERLTARRAAGTALGFAGVVVAIGPETLTRFDPRSLAQLAALGAALSYGLAVAFARAFLGGLSPVVASAGMLSGAALVIVPVAWAVEGRPSLDLAPVTLAAIGYYSVVSTAFAYLLYYRLIRAAGSGNAGLVTLLIPPVAIWLGAQVRGEALSPTVYLGFAILAAGLAILNGWIRLPAPLTAPRRPR